MKPQVLRFVVALAITVALAVVATGARVESAAQAQTAVDIHVLPVQGNIYMIVGAGANITASVGENGVLLVDTGNAASADRVLAAIRSLSSGTIQYIINTQYRPDHTGGNEPLAQAGRRLADANSKQASVMAHENVLSRMSAPSGSGPNRPLTAWPTDTYFTERKELYFNNESIQIRHETGLTDGDSLVYFRKSDVISAGDLFITTTFPIIDVEAGGNVNGLIDGLNDILDLTIPADKEEDGTLVISGHGRLADELDVALYRDMVTIMRDRVQDAVNRGLTVAQVKAAKELTLDFEGRYGGNGGPPITDMFLEAVYKNLTTKK